MRHDKTWWARLELEERAIVMGMWKADKHNGPLGGYYPDDCGECPWCSNPSLGGGLCGWCRKELIALERKGDGQLEVT